MKKFSIRLKKIVNPKYSKNWWTDKCAILVRNRHKAKNKFRRHPTNDNLIQLRRAEALAKREIKAAKIASFREFCSGINESTPTKDVWNQIKRLKNKNPLLINTTNREKYYS